MRPAVSVILIRESAEQVTGSGCCGKLAGDDKLLGVEKHFPHSRRHQQNFGVLHRAVRAFFPEGADQPEVRIATVDPRNQLYLVPKLWRDVLRYRPGLRAGLRTMLQLFSLPAVVVNGRVISRRGEPVDPDSLCHTIREHLERQGIHEPASAGHDVSDSAV